MLLIEIIVVIVLSSLYILLFSYVITKIKNEN
jgi:hypothetical protein